jgi:hypothetical protein
MHFLVKLLQVFMKNPFRFYGNLTLHLLKIALPRAIPIFYDQTDSSVVMYLLYPISYILTSSPHLGKDPGENLSSREGKNPG